MRWVTNPKEAEYMRGRQKENRERCKLSAAETWMRKKLETTGFKWTRQAMWGYRLFDFWNCALGIAIEVDGAEHDGEYDAYRDRYNFLRSAIVVIRVRNFNEQDAEIALWLIENVGTWRQRKGRVRPGKKLLLANGMEMARSPTTVAARRAGKHVSNVQLKLGVN